MQKTGEYIHTVTAIGKLHCGYTEKFGIPRQPGLVEMPASIEMLPPYHQPEAFDGICHYSHLWIEFLFHTNVDRQWSPRVRPPRMGGNTKRGVFATRSPFRPNHIGLSCVQFAGLREEGGTLWVDIVGADMLHGTPILDIKPYLPYVDAVPNATDNFTGGAPAATLEIRWEQQARDAAALWASHFPGLIDIIEQTLAMDPRPAYQKDPERIYGVLLYDLDIQWRVQDDVLIILEINHCPSRT